MAILWSFVYHGHTVIMAMLYIHVIYCGPTMVHYGPTYVWWCTMALCMVVHYDPMYGGALWRSYQSAHVNRAYTNIYKRSVTNVPASLSSHPTLSLFEMYNKCTILRTFKNNKCTTCSVYRSILMLGSLYLILYIIHFCATCFAVITHLLIFTCS